MAMGLTKADSDFLKKVHKEAKEEKKKLDRKPSEPCEVKKVIVSSTKKGDSNTVDLTGGLIRLMYYESMLSNTIGVTYTYSDSGDTVNNNKKGSSCKNTGTAIDKLPIAGGNYVSLEFSDNRGNDLNLKLRVNKTAAFDDKTTKSAAQLQLISNEIYENQKDGNRVVECYEGKISQHIEKIAKDHLKTEKDIDIEETGAKNYKFIGHTRKPFYCINLLSTKAAPKSNKPGNTAGFIFWETSDGYHFKSLDTLLGQKFKKSIIYNESTDGDRVPAGYDLKAIDYSRQNAVDVEGKMIMGAYATKLMSFDLYDPKFMEDSMSSAKNESGENNVGSQDFLTLAGTHLPELSEDLIVPSRVVWQVKDTGSLPDGTTDQQLDKSKEENLDLAAIYNQSIMRYNQLFASTITVTVGGDFSLHAGDAVFVDFSSLKRETQTNDDVNENDGGLYVIADLAHYLSPKETYTKMNLIRDSTGREGNHTTLKAHKVTRDNFLSNIK
tara:strand:- start:39 stop:1523 length:1485 start_codon:yes stop_codon:yes gene_type:complete